jgi:hypothetical protein
MNKYLISDSTDGEYTRTTFIQASCRDEAQEMYFDMLDDSDVTGELRIQRVAA